MNHPKVSKEEMLKRVVRFKRDINKENAIPLMFIDSLLPGHHRLNYAVVGDTASENPDFKPILTQPHKFNIGSEPAWCFAVLEAHEVFEGKDPYWSSMVIKKAREMGFESDDEGRMKKPDNFEQVNAEMLEKMFNA